MITLFVSLLFLSACSLIPSRESNQTQSPSEAVRQNQSASPAELTDDQLDQAIENDLQSELDQDLAELESELNSADQELKNY